MIPQAPVFVTFTGDGTTTAFAFNKRIYLASDLWVYTYRPGTDLVPQKMTSGYTVAINGDFGGAVATITPAPAAGVKVGLLRQTALTQDIDISNTDYVPPSVVEQQLDRQAMMAQEAALFAALGLETDPFDFSKATRGGAVVVFDVNGNPTVGPTADQITGAQASATAAAASAAASAGSATSSAGSATASASSAAASLASYNSTVAAIAALGNPLVFKGAWDASAGTFPGAGVAHAGWEYIVTVAGTVGGVLFNIDDVIIALANNASTTVYAGNWYRLQSDLVASVAGRTGAVVLTIADIGGIPAIGASDADKRLLVNAAGTGFDKVYIGNIGYPSRFGTYDRTGVADSAAAVNSALASYKYVELGEGTFKLGSTISFPANYQRLIGVGKQRTILRPSTSNVPGVTIPDGTTGCELIGVTIDRSVTATSGGSGVKTGQTNLTKLKDIECANNWIGLELGPLGYGEVADYFIHDSFSHGIQMQNNAAIGTCQWYVFEGLIQANDGWGLIVAALNAGPTAVLLGDWDGVKTFANTLGGLALIGAAAIPIHGLRLKNAFIGGDGGGGEVYLDTYGMYHRIDASFLEQAGTGATGRGLATAASSVGNGLTVTANNINFNGVGLSLAGNKQHGASLSASEVSKLVGGDIQNNLGNGLVVADGTKARIVGVQFKNNTSGNLNVLANATAFRAEGCFPDSVNTNGQRTGTATNDSAVAGNVGEYVETVVAIGAAVALTTATPKDFATISLTAGDWDVELLPEFTGGTTTTLIYAVASVSSGATNVLDQTNGRYVAQPFASATVFNNVPNAALGLGGIAVRMSLAGTTTIRAVAQAAFGVSTCSAYGVLRARRVR